MGEHKRPRTAIMTDEQASDNGVEPLAPAESSASVPPSPAPSLPSPAGPPKEYYASICPGPGLPLPPPFVSAIQELETSLGMPVWFLIQTERTDMLRPAPLTTIDPALTREFYAASRGALVAGTPIALLIVSPGGSAREAYRIATLLHRHCGGFTAVLPQWAKSAATLLTLGAGHVIFGRQAEIGPLDAQIFDPDREGYGSALNEYQSLERLHAAALGAIDQSVAFWHARSLKKIDRLLPLANEFVADMMRPLFDKIDTVHYTETARILKEGEEYAIRLLARSHPEQVAGEIARALVENYPAHDFVIDAEEARKLVETSRGPVGLRASDSSVDLDEIFDQLEPFFDSTTIIGRLEEVTAP